MKSLIFLSALLLPLQDVSAQTSDVLLGSGREPVRVEVGARYQRFDDAGEIAEMSVPFALSAPLGRRVMVGLQGSYASVTGAGIESISGVADAQASVAYSMRLGTASMVMSLAANLPSGTQELTSEAFETSILLSRPYYDFAVPSLGQGFNLAPGVTWAVPVSPSLVVGLGASYQLKGSYTPLREAERYRPGNEILVTGGLDYQPGRSAALSGDVSYTIYSSDRWGDLSYTAGDKLTASAQYLALLGFNELRFLARYRSSGRSDVPSGAGPALRVPSHLDLAASYRARVNRMGWLGFAVRGGIFGDASEVAGRAGDGKSLVAVRVLPEFVLSRTTTVPVRLGYTFGSFSGFDAGVGLSLRL